MDKNERIRRWGNLRYFPISSYYRSIFGKKIYKISVSLGKGCPNRIKGDPESGCVFCDEWGSAAYYVDQGHTLRDQIRTNREMIRRRFNADQFLVYFQAYTNSLGHIPELVGHVEEGLREADVVGAVIGTRPDCIPEDFLAAVKNLSERNYLSIELGVQSFFDHHLKFLNRGHTAEDSLKAIRRMFEYCKVDIGIHLIFGIPGESLEEIMETARIINSLPVKNVKLHNLHVLKNTALSRMYARGDFVPDELEDYSAKVALFLRYLSPEIAIQRLTAVANRWDDLVAPEWTKRKMLPRQYIDDRLERENIYQGMCLVDSAWSK